MSEPGNANRVAAALEYLRSKIQFCEFDNQERVVHVAVYDASNADEFAEHIGHLRDLQKLIIKATDLTDEGLRKLKPLANLRELSLASPRLSGSGLANLDGMNKLKELVLHGSACLDEKAFAHLPQLRALMRLSVYGGDFCDADLAPLAVLSNLEELEISDNDNVNGTFTTHLTELPRLRELGPGKKLTDEGLASIARLVRLNTLFLEGPFTDSGLLLMSSLSRLEVLYVTSDRVTAEGLAVVAELPELTRLGLDITPLPDAIVPVLSRCKSLSSLILFCSNLTSEGLRQLRRALPDCEIDNLNSYKSSS